jgi:hypothetical protein
LSYFEEKIFFLLLFRQFLRREIVWLELYRRRKKGFVWVVVAR